MTEMNFETIRWSFNEETGVGTIVLDRPDAMNSLSTQLKSDIVAGFDAFAKVDDEADGVAVRAVVVEGAGEKAFCAGADINEFREVTPGVFEMVEAIKAPEQCPAPVVAKIDGYCLGGGLELALACDFRIANDRSTVGQPEVDLGIIPGGGGTQRLAALVGPSRAKYLCMSGTHLEADTAAEDGILDAVHPADELDAAVDSFLTEIVEKPPLAVRTVKDVVNVSQEVGMQEGRMYEKRATDGLKNTADHAESVEAFAEGREPEWQGK